MMSSLPESFVGPLIRIIRKYLIRIRCRRIRKLLKTDEHYSALELRSRKRMIEILAKPGQRRFLYAKGLFVVLGFHVNYNNLSFGATAFSHFLKGLIDKYTLSECIRVFSLYGHSTIEKLQSIGEGKYAASKIPDELAFSGVFKIHLLPGYVPFELDEWDSEAGWEEIQLGGRRVQGATLMFSLNRTGISMVKVLKESLSESC